jgi:hypothetical protein
LIIVAVSFVTNNLSRWLMTILFIPAKCPCVCNVCNVSVVGTRGHTVQMAHSLDEKCWNYLAIIAAPYVTLTCSS